MKLHFPYVSMGRHIVLVFFISKFRKSFRYWLEKGIISLGLRTAQPDFGSNCTTSPKAKTEKLKALPGVITVVKPLVKENDRIIIGDKIVEFDLEQIKAAGYDPTVMVVVTNSYQYDQVQVNLDNSNSKQLLQVKPKDPNQTTS
ncbi:PTS glucose transporter subunit IIA [Paenibacillus sp. FSL R5-0473]|uniref:PTS glucose transporter subunit IIA n=1 Tax=Paenibacillus sp. FSL R5-0473 TaxID=2921642 RepID=UPI0030F75780